MALVQLERMLVYRQGVFNVVMELKSGKFNVLSGLSGCQDFDDVTCFCVQTDVSAFLPLSHFRRHTISTNSHPFNCYCFILDLQLNWIMPNSQTGFRSTRRGRGLLLPPALKKRSILPFEIRPIGE